MANPGIEEYSVLYPCMEACRREYVLSVLTSVHELNNAPLAHTYNLYGLRELARFSPTWVLY